MRSVRSALAATVVASIVFLPGAAQAKGAKKASASPGAALLAEGKKLMAAGNYAEACPKIADSQSQEPSTATAMVLGACYRKAGKLASAWATYKTAAESATNKKLAAAAKRSADELEPKLSRLTIKAEDGSGVDVRLDGQAVAESDLGNAVPRDGGGHDIEASASGKKTWTKHVDLAESGQTLEVDIPKLQDDGSASAAPVPGDKGEAKSEAEKAPAPEPPHQGLNGQRIAGIATAGVGVAAVILGAYAGIHANSTYNDALAACGGTTMCAGGSQGLSLRSSASTWATVSTVSFVVGGAAIAGGAVLFFTAPSDKPAQPAVGVGPASQGTGLSLVGRF